MTANARDSAGGALSRARIAFDSKEWTNAFALLAEAERTQPLDAEDLERLGSAAYLLGDDAWIDAWGRAYKGYLEARDASGATRCAFWLAFSFMNEGEMAHAGGWIARAERLVEEHRLDGAECGYLMLPGAIEACGIDPAASLEVFGRAFEIGERCQDQDLVALARHGQGRAYIRLAEPARGMSLLDEVLVAVSMEQLSPIVVGDLYCGVIEACQESFDAGRAREWTAALVDWCASQPDLVPFRGQCMVYRSIVLQLNGSWGDAATEASAACTRLTEPTVRPAAGAAYYQRAELHRLRGEVARAEESYALANQHGRDPQPGLAQLRLSQGQPDAAVAGLRRALHEATERPTRLRLLPAYVEALIASGDVSRARTAADELAGMVEGSDSPYLSALASHASGAVLLCEGDAPKALNALRSSLIAWESLLAPYEAARTRTLIAEACRQLGDLDGAELERQAALRGFEGLGAALDLARLVADGGDPLTEPVSGLTSRELDVLRLVAQGKTNRLIGNELVISEKTVARHVSNIFTKLELSNRAAATAYAYEHKLI